MKAWIGSDCIESCVAMFKSKPLPEEWNETYSTFVWGYAWVALLRKDAQEILNGSGLELPRHGTKDLVEIELTASKP